MGVLARVARVTERRGPHAFGFAWIDRRGRVKCYKQTGRITDHLGLLAMAADARMLIGHCRYATQGNPADNMNNHPHPADGGWLVHNGQVRNYDELMQTFGLYPVSACDSEVLGLLVERGEGSVLDRCKAAVQAACPEEEPGSLFAARSPLVLLGLWPRPDRLVAVRRGNPLHVAQTEQGDYLASLAEGLPGNVQAVRDGTACLFTAKGVNHATL
jgi:glucosamine 6-phosphate synthetase-like amidotransferase/phosphosugar isomerase protein